MENINLPEEHNPPKENNTSGNDESSKSIIYIITQFIIKKSKILVLFIILIFICLTLNLQHKFIVIKESGENIFIWICLAFYLIFIITLIFYKKIHFENLAWKRFEYAIHASGMIAFIFAIIEIYHIKTIKSDVSTSIKQITTIIDELPSRELDPFPRNMPQMIKCLNGVEKSLIIYTDAPAYGSLSSPEEFEKYAKAIEHLFKKDSFSFIFIHPCERKYKEALMNQFKNDTNAYLSSVDNKMFLHCIDVITDNAKNDPIDFEKKNKYTYKDMFDYVIKINERFIHDIDQKHRSSTKKNYFEDISLEINVENNYWIFDDNKIIYSFISTDTNYTEPSFYSENKDLVNIITIKYVNPKPNIKCGNPSDIWLKNN